MSFKRYIVVASRFGDLHVAVEPDFKPFHGDVILYRAYTIDEAFDWKESTETEIARMAGLHCPTCE